MRKSTAFLLVALASPLVLHDGYYNARIAGYNLEIHNAEQAVQRAASGEYLMVDSQMRTLSPPSLCQNIAITYIELIPEKYMMQEKMLAATPLIKFISKSCNCCTGSAP